MSVYAYVCVCLRKKDVSDPCGPVYLHACVGVEGGQKQGCLYPSPFPWLLCHRHSGHRRMKRLWIFSPPPYTHQSRKIRQKMSTAWPIQSSFKPNTGSIWPEFSGSWSTSTHKTCIRARTHAQINQGKITWFTFPVQSLVTWCLGLKCWHCGLCTLRCYKHTQVHTPKTLRNKPSHSLLSSPRWRLTVACA